MSRLPSAAALAALLWLAPGPPAAAQQPERETPPLEAGARVRVTDPALGPKPLVGLVAGALGDTLAVYFTRRSAPDTLLLSGVQRIEASRGFGSPPYARAGARGAGAGLLVGLAAAVAIQAAGNPGGYGIDFVGLIVVPPAVGLGLVAGVLSARPEERWEPVRPGGTVAAGLSHTSIRIPMRSFPPSSR